MATREYIGKYRLLKLVRAGKTAQIWEAMDPADNERIALKALHGDYCKDKHEIALLKHEYAVGNALDHEAVNRVRAFDIAKGTPFVAMDYFAGPNIKQAMRSHPQVIDKFTDDIVRLTAEGLGHMHDIGWVHCDVKPDNYLINSKAVVKLIDFSIAQKIKKKGGFGKLFKGKNKVQGTMSYMSPEQIRGEQVDARADIYSLGCMYYELLSGKMPYTGISANDLLTKHLRASVPSLSSVNENVTREFTKLVLKMMAKKPDQRPDSIKKVLDTLEKIRIRTIRRPTAPKE